MIKTSRKLIAYQVVEMKKKNKTVRSASVMVLDSTSLSHNIFHLILFLILSDPLNQPTPLIPAEEGTNQSAMAPSLSL